MGTAWWNGVDHKITHRQFIEHETEILPCNICTVISLERSLGLVSSPDPDSQQLRVDYITATWKVGMGNKNDALVPSVLQCLCPKIVRQSKFRINLAQLDHNRRYHFRMILLRYRCKVLAVLLRRTGCALLSFFQAGYCRTSL